MRISRRLVLATAFVLCLAFGAYLVHLYHQLTVAFSQQRQFVPTRIYSDVSHISPPQPRSQVEARLQALGYQTKVGENSITFTLHALDYPEYLLPDNHPTLQAAQHLITLNFTGNEPSAPLHSIQAGSDEIPDIYLEPELVAILNRAGNAEGRNEIRAWAKFQDIPAPVWKAIIAIEDQHFLEHKGFDPRGLARAIWVNLKTHSLAQGGSTLTQQLVKNLMERHGKNVFRKINELFLSILLEVKFDKEQILERYLNEVYLGQVGNYEVHGVVEGAELFFDRKLEELNLAEIALMAGLIRGPGFYSPYRYKQRALDRQKLVLKKMVETGQIAQEEADAALKMPIRLAPPRTTSNKAPYFADFVKAELIRQLKDRINEQDIISASFRVYTTLDMTMNTAAQKAVAQGISELEKRLKLTAPDRLEGALAAVDQSTGYIRALIGGRSYGQSTFNRILNMKRQVGSTFKPFVYLAAFEKGEDPNGVPYAPGHPIEDAPWKLVYDKGRQNWEPKNYEKEFLGWISFRTALAHSINTAASKLGIEIGIDRVIKTAQSMGIHSDLPNVPSLSLGVAELSPVELLQAYATLGNHGVQDELTVIRGITQDDGTNYARFVYHPKEVFAAGPVDLLTEMMQNVFIEGTAKGAAQMGFDRPAAGKTGTTSHHRDSWFAGFTPQLTAVVWVGMDQTPTPGGKTTQARKPIMLTGANSALPIWVNFMKDALAGEPPVPFPQSPQLSSVRIDKYTGKRASVGCPDSQVIQENYWKEHEPKDQSCEALWPASIRVTDLH